VAQRSRGKQVRYFFFFDMFMLVFHFPLFHVIEEIVCFLFVWCWKPRSHSLDLYYNVNSTFVASFEGNNFVAFDVSPDVSIYESYGLHVIVRNVPGNATAANATLVPYLERATQVFGFPNPANNANFFDLNGE
jgi:hypothetical protein